jgi:hypothetical protein
MLTSDGKTILLNQEKDLSEEIR